jgi:phosphoribosylamine--glycine ligase/phosphoribosylformylglycinamidine cyclo-ligase
MDLKSSCPWAPSTTIGEQLLTPTTIYVKQLLPCIRQGLIKGLSHITGGGFTENVPRVLPAGVGCWVDATTFEFLPVFKSLMKMGGVEAAEMARTFNCGIGMVVVVGKDQVEEVTKRLNEDGAAKVYRIGEVQDGEGCVMRGLESWSS